MRLKTLTFFSVYALSLFAVASEPSSKIEQCLNYGSYQDVEGNWESCSAEDFEIIDSPKDTQEHADGQVEDDEIEKEIDLSSSDQVIYDK